MSTNPNVDQVHYRTETTALPPIVSGHQGIRFLRIIRFTYPASPLSIVQYERDGVEQKDGMRLDLQKFAFLDHYTEDLRTERDAAQQIVAFLASTQNARAFTTAGD
jgi:hypothetical protein